MGIGEKTIDIDKSVKYKLSERYPMGIGDKYG